MKFLTCMTGLVLSASLILPVSANSELVPVPAPPVPEGWTLKLLDKVLIYEAPKIKNAPETQLRVTYSRSTHEEDAEAFSKSYATTHKCEYNKQVGVGFYTLKCEEESIFAIVIGELNNMYLMEIKGAANEAAKIMVNNYIKELINGKHVFGDRHIGDPV